ncbi:hypothetical protein NL676_035732 [Syzygium grande]|nr:hypothetical protein NL676_035732 [Syzygium grande]
MKSRNARKDQPQYFPYCGWSLFFLPLLRTINGGCERKGLSTPRTRSSPAQAPETVVLASACDLIALLDELDLESTGLGTRGCESGNTCRLTVEGDNLLKQILPHGVEDV